jgi:hypothetical protein
VDHRLSAADDERLDAFEDIGGHLGEGLGPVDRDGMPRSDREARRTRGVRGDPAQAD